jgi:microcystin-dependent protein
MVRKLYDSEEAAPILQVFNPQVLDINSAGDVLGDIYNMASFTTLRVQAEIATGSWASTELELIYTVDNNTWYVLPDSATITAVGITLFFVPCCLAVNVRVKTAAGGAATATISAHADKSYRAEWRGASAYAIGDLTATMEASAQSGWLVCEGETISDTGDGGDYAGPEYETLFGILKDVAPNAGTEVWGTDTVTLPDLRRASLSGMNGSGTGVLGNGIGASGGTETHALVTSEMPAHTHTYDRQSGAGAVPNITTVANATAAATNTTNSTGGDGAHNNMPPRVNVRFVIRYA